MGVCLSATAGIVSKRLNSNMEVVGAALNGIIFDDLECFKVTGYLQVEYLADGARVFTRRLQSTVL